MFLTNPRLNVMVRAITRVACALFLALPASAQDQQSTFSPDAASDATAPSSSPQAVPSFSSQANRTAAAQQAMHGVPRDSKLMDLYIPINSPGCAAEKPLDALSGPGSARPPINGDYFVIIHDATAHTTSWWDYDHLVVPGPYGGYVPAMPVLIPASGRAFLPVLYSREKVAVHVCNLRISDSLTVTMNPTVVPENGADIRGAAATASVSALAASTDMLFASGSTGLSTTPGTLGYSSNTPLPSTVVSGYAAGVTAADKGNPAGPLAYTDASITVAPRQLAALMRLAVHDAKSVSRDVRQFRTGTSANPVGFNYPGSVGDIERDADQLITALSATPLQNNPGQFNHFVDETSALAGEVNSLGSALSSTSLGARAESIRSSYAAIHSVLELAQGIVNADAILNTSSDATEQAALCAAMKPPPATPAKCTAALTKAGYAGLGTLCSGGKGGADTASCKYFEAKTFSDFLDSYCAEFGIAGHPAACLAYGDVQTNTAVTDVDRLHKNLVALDRRIGRIFQTMNDWYESSRIEQTDILAPAGTNAVERISILIHRTYVPFILAGSSQISSTASAGGGAGGSGGGAGAAGAAGGAAAASGGGGGGGGGAGAAGGGGAAVSTPAFSAETVYVEVHRRANFNIVGGAMAILVSTSSYSPVQEFAQQMPNPTYTTTNGQSPYIYPAMCNGGTPPEDIPVSASGGVYPSTAPFYCIAQQQTSNWQVAGMVGIDWFFPPFQRDYFPRGTGGSVARKNLMPVPLFATSVTSLGNLFAGGNIELANGINFFGGRASAHQTTLPSGYSMTTVLEPAGSGGTPPTIPTATHLRWGWSFGVGFDLSVFTQIFGKASGASAP